MAVNIAQDMKITLTPQAVTKVREIMAQQSEAYEGLRLRVVGGGCSGFQYQMFFDKEAGDDPAFDFGGLKVFVDERSLMYINGTQIDYIDGLHGAGFKFENPNTKGTCGCGESFQV